MIRNLLGNTMENQKEISWFDEVAEGNYIAAESYLTLLFDEKKVAGLILKLRESTITQFKSKDVFRASQLSLLGISNERVEKNRKKIKNGASFSPILLLRDPDHGKVVIADGYHRMCAIYGFDEDVWIRCKII